MSESSPVAVMGEAMWGDVCGCVYILQVHRHIQHVIDSHTAIQSCLAQKPQLLIQSISSELYDSPNVVADENLQLPSFFELTLTNLAPRRTAPASFVAAHSRFISLLLMLLTFFYCQVSLVMEQSLHASISIAEFRFHPQLQRFSFSCHQNRILRIFSGTQNSARRLNKVRGHGCWVLESHALRLLRYGICITRP
jgi:hypothetical protein